MSTADGEVEIIGEIAILVNERSGLLYRQGVRRTGGGGTEGPRPAVVNGGRDWQMSPSRFEVAYLQAPQTGPLYGHGMQS